MSVFFERFKNHPVHQTISDLSAALDSSTPDLTESSQIAGYARFRRVFALAKERLGSVDPELISPSALKAINGAVNSMKAQHEAFVNSKDWQALNQPVDQMLDQLRLVLPHTNGQAEGHVFADTLDLYQRQASALLESTRSKAEQVTGLYQRIEEKLTAFESKLAAFEQVFEAQKGRIDSLIGEQQNQFTQRLNTYDTQVAEQKARIDALIGDQQAQFAVRADERSTKFNDQQSRIEQAESLRIQQFKEFQGQLRTEFEQLTSNANEGITKVIAEDRLRLDALLAEHEQQSRESINGLKARLDEAVRIVGLIGNTGLTGNYQRLANDERKVANTFRWIAIACMTVMVACVAWIVSHVTSEGFNWQIALFRLIAAVAFGAPAWYCARESTRHRRIEQRNRRIELELASLSPYLAELPDGERLKIVGELSREYFGGEIVEEVHDDKILKLKNMRLDEGIRLIEQIGKILK